MKRRALATKQNAKEPQVLTRNRSSTAVKETVGAANVTNGEKSERENDKENAVPSVSGKTKMPLRSRQGQTKKPTQKQAVRSAKKINGNDENRETEKAKMVEGKNVARKRTRSSSSRNQQKPPSKKAVTMKEEPVMSADNNMKEELHGTDVTRRRSLRLRRSQEETINSSDPDTTLTNEGQAVKTERNVSDGSKKLSGKTDEPSEVSSGTVKFEDEENTQTDISKISEASMSLAHRLVRSKNFNGNLDEMTTIGVSSQSSVSACSSTLSSPATVSSKDSSCYIPSSSDSEMSVEAEAAKDRAVQMIVREMDKILEEKRSEKFEADRAKHLANLKEAELEKEKQMENERLESKAELLPVPRNALFLKYDKDNILEDKNNPAYMHDVFSYLKSKEVNYAIGDFIAKQPHITTKMRTILFDWFIEVQEALALNHEIIYHAFKMCDMYLTKKQILKTNYQLLGVTCLFIATKYDDRIPAPMTDFLDLCGSTTYFEDDLIRLEQDILRRLKFDIGYPLSYRFLRRYSTVQNNNFTVLCQARFFLECSVLEYAFCKYRESLLAAGSLMLAHLTLGTGTWCKDVEYASGYKKEELTDIMRLLNDNTRVLVNLFKNQKRRFNIVRKYTSPLFKNVASNPLVDNKLIIEATCASKGNS